MGPGNDGSTSDDAAYRTAHYPASPKTYSDYATLDLPLSFDKTQVKVDYRSHGSLFGTPMRSAIYKSVNEINTHGRSTAIKAIILLSDGDYNWYGDPLARGSGHTTWVAEDYNDLDTDYYKFTSPVTPSSQNMSQYAKDNGIRIYSIAFGNYYYLTEEGQPSVYSPMRPEGNTTWLQQLILPCLYGNCR